jgi:hypothetical protein
MNEKKYSGSTRFEKIEMTQEQFEAQQNYVMALEHATAGQTIVVCSTMYGRYVESVGDGPALVVFQQILRERGELEKKFYELQARHEKLQKKLLPWWKR